MTRNFSFDIDGSGYSFSSIAVEDLANDVEIVFLRFWVDTRWITECSNRSKRSTASLCSSRL